MPKRTDIDTILIIGARRTPLPGGERAVRLGEAEASLVEPGEGAFKREEDALRNAFRVREHIAVREAKDAVTVLGQIGIPRAIALTFGVLPAIDLDDELPLRAGKVGYPSPDGKLTPELEAAEAAVTETMPEAAFRIGHPSALRTGSRHTLSLHVESSADGLLTLSLSPAGRGDQIRRFSASTLDAASRMA